MNSTVQVIAGTVILIAVLASIVTLAFHGTVAGSDAMVAITAIIGIAGGAFAVHAGVAAGANAANTIPSQDPPKV
jgi:hypothetical protein